jgi:hypothetical protein
MPRTQDSEAKRRRSRWAESLGLKIQALLWVLAAGLTVYFTDFIDTCLNDSRVNRYKGSPHCFHEFLQFTEVDFRCRAYFNVALATFAASATIVLYLAVYLPYFRRIDTDWLEYCPNVVYTATAFGVLSALT